MRGAESHPSSGRGCRRLPKLIHIRRRARQIPDPAVWLIPEGCPRCYTRAPQQTIAYCIIGSHSASDESRTKLHPRQETLLCGVIADSSETQETASANDYRVALLEKD